MGRRRAKSGICDLPATSSRIQREERFMTMNSKVCSMLRGEEQGDFTIKQVDLLSHVEVLLVFHCYGLLLCVTAENSRLLLCNPFLGQTRWISARSWYRATDRFALGYDRKKRTHKILRCGDSLFGGKVCQVSDFEIYDLSSHSWRILDITSEWAMEDHERGATLKGDTYFFARKKTIIDEANMQQKIERENFLICFDFTKERFGPHLPLPFESHILETVALSCVGEDRLAVLRQQNYEDPFYPLEIWVTSMVEPEAVSWTKFLKLDKTPVTWFGHVMFRYGAGSFFIDEEEKTAVVFDVDSCEVSPPPWITRPTEPPQHTAFIMGDDGYVKYVRLGEAPDLCRYVGPPETYYPTYRPPLVCSSSYLPSVAQIN